MADGDAPRKRGRPRKGMEVFAPVQLRNKRKRNAKRGMHPIHENVRAFTGDLMRQVRPLINVLADEKALEAGDLEKLERYLDQVSIRLDRDEIPHLRAHRARVKHEHHYTALAERLSILEQKKNMGRVQLSKMEAQHEKQTMERSRLEEQDAKLDTLMVELKAKEMGPIRVAGCNNGLFIPNYMLPASARVYGTARTAQQLESANRTKDVRAISRIQAI